MPNPITHTFASDKELLSYVGEKANLLTGCCKCGLIWPLQRKLKELESPEIFWNICDAIFKINAKGFSVEQLRKLKLHISFSDICPECFSSEASFFVEGIKEEQRAEGYSDCFCSGHASCNQCDCKHKAICIRNENISPAKKEYFTHLFETAFIPISLNAH